MQIMGFTGRQSAPTIAQRMSTHEQLVALGPRRLHHGDCVGADEMVHDQALDLGIRVYLHPPDNPAKRAFCRMAIGTFAEAPYMVRNQVIVDKADELLAVVPGPEKSYPRAGEWATVRRARKKGIPIHLVWPDGSVTIDAG